MTTVAATAPLVPDATTAAATAPMTDAPVADAERRGRAVGGAEAGKTGTSQVYSLKGEKYSKQVDERLRDHAWYIAYAPADQPRIAIAVLVALLLLAIPALALFPFTTQHFTIGMWAYASQEGRYGDAAAYREFVAVWGPRSRAVVTSFGRYSHTVDAGFGQ